MLNDRENILSALREKPLKVYEIMKRANVVNEEACQSLLLKMRDEGLVKFDIHKGRWLVGWSAKMVSGTGRIGYAMTAAALSQVSNGAEWNPDPSFSVAEAILDDPAFASVLRAVLSDGHVVVPAAEAKGKWTS
jgi:hypothetical protein